MRLGAATFDLDIMKLLVTYQQGLNRNRAVHSVMMQSSRNIQYRELKNGLTFYAILGLYVWKMKGSKQ